MKFTLKTVTGTALAAASAIAAAAVLMPHWISADRAIAGSPAPESQVAALKNAETDSDRAILSAHNRYRAEVGVPPLRWSSSLAAGAREWAIYLANSNTFKHSDTQNGENLAIGTAGAYSPTELVDLWGAEKQYFQPNAFPNVSTTGNWSDVGHYTQMIWRDTTEVGCAIATGNGDSVLVCRYSPPGNYTGRRVY